MIHARRAATVRSKGTAACGGQLAEAGRDARFPCGPWTIMCVALASRFPLPALRGLVRKILAMETANLAALWMELKFSL